MDEALEEIGRVSGEGGPLLLADLITVTSWRGIAEGGKDYERACDLLLEGPGVEGCAIAIGGETGVVWEMEGGGTAGVFRRGQDYAIVTRIWPEDPDDTRTFRVLAEVAAADIARIAELSIASGVLAILWAPEDGRAFESLDPAGLPMGEMSMGGTGLTLELAPGVYDCFHDAVSNAAGDARRCHLVRRAG